MDLNSIEYEQCYSLKLLFLKVLCVKSGFHKAKAYTVKIIKTEQSLLYWLNLRALAGALLNRYKNRSKKIKDSNFGNPFNNTTPAGLLKLLCTDFY